MSFSQKAGVDNGGGEGDSWGGVGGGLWRAREGVAKVSIELEAADLRGEDKFVREMAISIGRGAPDQILVTVQRIWTCRMRAELGRKTVEWWRE